MITVISVFDAGHFCRPVIPVHLHRASKNI
jgi:hypothetical protein